ncbi:Calpain-type cysteine protease DEK1 [Seminavis robusta]|uniref:Calpain-type cysteine protease DEK1 n=1 Tax=Seminavis robusta TaxID=568900 RepID=A0A9N8EL86_9STRA|nr:Calpain-type cysteine protease DEK1 [Seminavis robusta]|eukprot:Sro1380_g267780.1 Calpain-type cysteine protease DEK1 (1139) ;mRNA; f:10819-14330
MSGKDEAIELLSDDEIENTKPPAVSAQPAATIKKASVGANRGKMKAAPKRGKQARPLQAGIVLEEDVEAIVQQQSDAVDRLNTFVHEQLQRRKQGKQTELYHDPDFQCAPSSIQGSRKEGKAVKCKCGVEVQLAFSVKGPNSGRPYWTCGKPKHHQKGGPKRCDYFSWAFRAETMHWYRFGEHLGQTIVGPGGFQAAHLVQGKLGTCWFLSTLAVVAERPDLISRIIGGPQPGLPFGILKVNMFQDGFWTPVLVDNFLPCILDGESEVQQAINASLGVVANDARSVGKSGNSKHDPTALTHDNRRILSAVQAFLQEQQQPSTNPYAKKEPVTGEAWRSYLKDSAESTIRSNVPLDLNRKVTIQDLAYSKGKEMQLWPSLLEKAYAKCHASFNAVSGGWLDEAFLDLTGSPTLSFSLMSSGFDARHFWYKLLSFHHQRLPIGCATDSSAGGIIGRHAYSILDVHELKNVPAEFFHNKLADRSLGNVSGFTSFDQTLRLVRIRNPHGRGEWKGEWSDNDSQWRKLLLHLHREGSTLPPPSLVDDGTFYIAYDEFLMAFSTVTVVLAFEGNHARSFASNFPEKLSTHRCTRAFEVALISQEAGGPARDTVELYVMGIQKTRRGASLGRTDRKVSYKISDLGLLIANEGYNTVDGSMLGFKKAGHHRIILNRKKNNQCVVMPVSFGHPAATDPEKSFSVRFVADAPLMIRELPEVPRMDLVLHKFCFQPIRNMGQRKCKVVLDDKEGVQLYGEPRYRVIQVDCLADGGGVVFVYGCINRRLLKRKDVTNDRKDFSLNLQLEATCRGMMCRTETGFLDHETIAKGKKFQAAWRRFTCQFPFEVKTRVLFVLVQSGQDTEMGSVTGKCQINEASSVVRQKALKQAVITTSGGLATKDTACTISYESFGIFNNECDVESEDDSLHNAMFGSIDALAASGAGFVGGFGLDGFDPELEQALALPRGDLELQAALEMSKADTTTRSNSGVAAMSEDEAIRVALQLSKGDNFLEPAARNFYKDYQTAEDQALQEAIKRSLQAEKSTSNGEVVVLDDVADGAADHIPPPSKKQRTASDEVIEIDDDSDADEEQAREDDNKKGEDSATPTCTGIEADDDDKEGKGAGDRSTELAERRRRAAEAAEKRLRLN